MARTRHEHMFDVIPKAGKRQVLALEERFDDVDVGRVRGADHGVGHR